MSGRLRALASALFLGGVLLGVSAVAPGGARAADRDLTLTSAATYTVDPTHSRVHVAANILARNTRTATKTARYYATRTFLAVPPGTTGFKISGRFSPRVHVTRRTSTYTLLRIDLGSRFYGGSAARWQLQFDLADSGGAATRSLRVGESFVAFPVWAFASDTAVSGTVSVIFPPGYDVTVESGAMPRRTTTSSGQTVLSSGPIRKPTRWFAYLTGSATGGMASTPLAVPVGASTANLSVQAWKDDPAWASQVSSVVRDGLPRLGSDIGLPWPSTDPLTITEAHGRSSDAFAGVFDPTAKRMEIAYYASPFVVLHEAAHAWFNGGLLSERWANEGFASLYAERAAGAMKLEVPAVKVTAELKKAAMPLNAWPSSTPASVSGTPAATADPAQPAQDYAYAASVELARLIAERAGDDALRQIWSDASNGVGAYQPPPASSAAGQASPEQVDAKPDWRALLDLLEERTGKSFDDLWQTWVVRPDEVPLLDARASAREAYARTVRLAGDWRIPQVARDAMRAWRFDEAERYLADVRTVLSQRAALQQAASRSSLVLSDSVHRLFEAGQLHDASTAARDQLAAVGTIETAAATKPAAPDLFQQLGLMDVHPDAMLSDAKAAFASGDVATAVARAGDARATWESAWEEGRQRILVTILALTLVVIVGSLLFQPARRRVISQLGTSKRGGPGEANDEAST